MTQKLKIFIVYHKTTNENIIFKNLSPEYIKTTMVYYGVNNIYEKKIDNKYGCDEILEYELKIYNPFIQLRGYLETSSYLHIYNNNLHKDLDFIGVFQYDMVHNKEYKNLDDNTIYFYDYDINEKIVNNGEWGRLMFHDVCNIDFLLTSYNNFFATKISKKDLEKIQLSLFQTNIYPKKIFNKLCSWLNVLIKDIYPWSINPPYQTHWGNLSGLTERSISLFNAIEIFLGYKYENLELNHIELLEKNHYGNNINSFLIYFDLNCHTKYMDDITNKESIDGIKYASFKSIWHDGNDGGIDNFYYAERLTINSKDGLILGRKKNNEYKLVGFDMNTEDPRMIHVNGKLYVTFTSLSPYEGQQRGIGISEFYNWNPICLRIRNTPINIIEKNWAPFVKNNELFFVYNYDPLVIIKYDFNADGFCDIVFTQNNIQLPINTNEPNILRGGSNLIHYKNEYYIGGCHDRSYINGSLTHYTRIILLDVNNWKIKYVSKPIIYNNYGETNKDGSQTYRNMKKIPNTNILYDNLNLNQHIETIQDPVSITKDENNVFYITNSVSCVRSFLYKLDIDIPTECLQNYENIGCIQRKVYNEMLQICI